MSDFYADMQATAAGILGEFKQGVVKLRRVTTSDPPAEAPWEPGTETTTDYGLSATVKRVDQRYENGTLIVATGDIVTFAVPAVEPSLLTDKLVIDGTERVMTSLKRIPSAGTAVAYKAFCEV